MRELHPLDDGEEPISSYGIDPHRDDSAGKASQGPVDEMDYGDESRSSGLRWFVIAVAALLVIGSCTLKNTLETDHAEIR